MSSRTAVPALSRTIFSSQVRGLRTSTSALAAQGGRGGARSTDDARRPDGWDIKNVEPFQFDDTTTIGHMILERQREKVGTLMKIEQDRALLQERAKAFPFQPPNPETHYLRLTSFHNTSDPNDPLTSKKVLRVPVSRLPLTSPESMHRFKLLVGPRWLPPTGVLPDGSIPKDVSDKLDVDEKEGWFVMSEEGWKEGRMNRKWLSDILDKLVEESNNPKSSIAADTPLDIRSQLAREQKKKRTRRTQGTHVPERKRGMEMRGDGGGIKGFPETWL